MGKLINTLRQLVKEELALAEDRIGKGLGVDPEKAEKFKKLYPKDYILYKIVDAIENAGDKIITRNGYTDPSTGNFVDGLMQMFGLKTPQILNAYISELVKSGIIVDKGTAIAKKEKPESTGQRGKKPNDKSKAGIIRTLFQNFKDNENFTPTEDDLTYDIPKGLGTEKLSDTELAKIKNSALGLSKRGRPASGKDDLVQKESLHEMYLQLHKKKRK